MGKIGLTQRVTVVKEYGERRDCLDQQWSVLLENLGHVPVPLCNRVANVDNYLDELNLDGVVLTSGNDLAHLANASNPAPERDRFEEAVLSYAIDERLPVLGVCRGLEFLNVYFDGGLTPVENHVARSHSLFFYNTNGVIDFPDKTMVNSYHDYGIDQDGVGDNLVVLGVASGNTVECVAHNELPIWGIMWHPERESPSATLDRKIINHLFGGCN